MAPAQRRTSSRLSARASAVAESVTLAVEGRAKALRAAGEQVISFAAGEPDAPSPPHVVEAAIAAAGQSAAHHYSPTGGLPELRQAIAEKTSQHSGFPVTASQVLVTNGSKQAISNAFAAIVDPGDEVLVPAPYWVTYPEAVAIAGGSPVVVPSEESRGFRVGPAELEAQWTSRTKALVLVSPSNPTGALYPAEELVEIGRWAAQRDVWVVADEIYEHLIYEPGSFASLPGLVEEMRDRCLVVSGVSKTYAMTGWRVGWMIGPRDVVAAATDLQSHSTSNVANVSQAAALAALRGGLGPVEEMRQAYSRRRKGMLALLRTMPGVTCVEPEGAFYAFPSFQGVLGRQIGGRRPTSTLELAEALLEETRVAVVPGEAFGAPGYLRLSFALADEDMEEGLSRIAGVISG
ncbi:MAG: pyridoxal phosphate-dependent aminotransferase [Acidimicrobiia bacterium]